jgi:putative addiction module component (TIGR02574 family)
MSAVDDVLGAALSLPPEDRAVIANKLFESLDADDNLSDVDQEWEQEIVRRVESYKRGESQAIDADIVFARIREELERSRKAQ